MNHRLAAVRLPIFSRVLIANKWLGNTAVVSERCPATGNLATSPVLTAAAIAADSQPFPCWSEVATTSTTTTSAALGLPSPKVAHYTLPLTMARAVVPSSPYKAITTQTCNQQTMTAPPALLCSVKWRSPSDFRNCDAGEASVEEGTLFQATVERQVRPTLPWTYTTTTYVRMYALPWTPACQ